MEKCLVTTMSLRKNIIFLNGRNVLMSPLWVKVRTPKRTEFRRDATQLPEFRKRGKIVPCETRREFTLLSLHRTRKLVRACVV